MYFNGNVHKRPLASCPDKSPGSNLPEKLLSDAISTSHNWFQLFFYSEIQSRLFLFFLDSNKNSLEEKYLGRLILYHAI